MRRLRRLWLSRAAEKAAKDVSTFLNATAKEEEERERAPLSLPPPLSGLYQGRLWEIQSSSLGGMVAWVECEYMASTILLRAFLTLKVTLKVESYAMKVHLLRGHVATSLSDRGAGIMSDFVRGSRRCCGRLGINPT